MSDPRFTLGGALVRALGLKNVKSIAFKCDIEDVAVLAVEQYLTDEQEQALCKVIRTFTVTLDSTQPAAMAPLGEVEARGGRLENQYLPGSLPPHCTDTTDAAPAPAGPIAG